MVPVKFAVKCVIFYFLDNATDLTELSTEVIFGSLQLWKCCLSARNLRCCCQTGVFCVHRVRVSNADFCLYFLYWFFVFFRCLFVRSALVANNLQTKSDFAHPCDALGRLLSPNLLVATSCDVGLEAAAELQNCLCELCIVKLRNMQHEQFSQVAVDITVSIFVWLFKS